MERKKRLERRTPLVNRTPLESKTPLRRGKPLTSGTDLRRSSFQRRAKPTGQRRKVKKPKDDAAWRKARALHLEAFPWCEVGRLNDVAEPCRGRPVTVHHVRNSGKGKRDHVPTNLMSLCFCHHTGPKGLHGRLGYSREDWAREWFGLAYEDLADLVKETRGDE